MSEETKQPRHLNRTRLLEIVQQVGAEYAELSKFDRVGPKKGPHLMVSRASKTSLIYGYGFQYVAPGVQNYTEEERKEKKLGGITLQLDLTHCAPGTEEMLYETFKGLVGFVHAEASKSEA